MRIIGCDLHARQQTLAMLDTQTGEVVNRTLMHEGSEVREFYSQLPHPAVVGIEAIGPMQWFLNLLEELGIECQVGCRHPRTGITTFCCICPRRQNSLYSIRSRNMIHIRIPRLRATAARAFPRPFWINLRR